MSEFTVRGRFRTSRGWSPFETAITAPNESVAVEHIYANLGSRHGVKRTQVEVEEVAEQ